MKEYPIISTENYRASTQVLQVNRCSQGTHKTSSVLWLRHKPAPPNEEQFNAPTTGGRAMKERIKI